MSRGQDSYSSSYVGSLRDIRVIEGPYLRSIRLNIRSFVHGSYELKVRSMVVESCLLGVMIGAYVRCSLVLETMPHALYWRFCGGLGVFIHAVCVLQKMRSSAS